MLQILTTQPNKDFYLQRGSLFGCVVSICSAVLYLVVLWVFAVRFFIWLCCEYLQCVSLFGCVVGICSALLYLVVFWAFARGSLFGCVVSICSVVLYLVVLWVFAVWFFIWLCCEYLQCVSLFGCVVSVCSVFLYLVVLWVFAVCFFIWLCCECLQCVSLFGCVVSVCSAFIWLCSRFQGFFICHMINYTGYNQKWNVGQIRSAQWTVQRIKKKIYIKN